MTAPENDLASLAAYADGELDTAGVARARELLESRPELWDELDSQKLFARRSSFWLRVVVPEPTETEWAGVLRRVRHGVARPQPIRSANLSWVYGAVALAAGILIAIAGRTGFAPPPERPAEIEPEVWACAADADVEIFSLRGCDFDLLVRGRLPLDEPLNLAAVGEIIVEAVRPEFSNGQPNRLETVQGTTSPIVVAPIDPPTLPVP